MCVIAVAVKRRVLETDIDKMVNDNPDGMGCAWIDKDGISFKKGIKLTELKELNKKIPLPYVLHFRIASAGEVCNELCHPFVVKKYDGEKIEMSGTADRVLFHNGHLTDWKSIMLMYAIKAGVWIKTKMSDTRLLSFLVAELGDGMLLDIGGGKYVFGSKEKGFLCYGEFEDDNGVWYSNTLWKTVVYNYYKENNYKWLEKEKRWETWQEKEDRQKKHNKPTKDNDLVDKDGYMWLTDKGRYESLAKKEQREKEETEIEREFQRRYGCGY